MLDSRYRDNEGLLSTSYLAGLPDFTLGNARISPSTRTVSGPGGSAQLEPRVMQVLVVLGHSAGRVVTRDMLFRRCWGVADVGDASLNRAIACARRVAGEIALDSFQIETVPRTGYLLRLEVGAAEPETLNGLPTGAEVQAGASASITGGGGRGISRRTMAVAGTAAAVTAVAGASGILTRGERTSDPEVARLMQQAETAVREGMPDDMARAAALYRMIIERDPDNAASWAGLAGVYRFQWEFSSPEEAPALQGRARSAARRALELDPDNGSAHATLAGFVPMFGNWAAAEAAMRRVFVRYPGKIQVRLARLLHETGRLREALPLARQAVAVDPEIPRYRNFYAKLLWDNGRLEEAEAALEAGLARWPRHLLLWFTRFWLLAYSGRPRAAMALAAERSDRPIGVPDRVFELATASARALATRKTAEIQNAVEQHLAAIPEGSAYAENATVFCAAVGRLDQAFDVLGAYYFGRGGRVSDARFGPETATYTPPYNRQCAFLFAAPAAPLRADPRFASLVREIGLESYWRETHTVPDYRRR